MSVDSLDIELNVPPALYVRDSPDKRIQSALAITEDRNPALSVKGSVIERR